MDWDVIVVGAGPAGLMAASRAAERGLRTLLLEKNPSPGAKILLSGGNRCNLTHATDRQGIVEAFGRQGPFLHSALAALGPQQVVDLFETEGLATKVEPGGKIFPQSDRAADVLAALLRRLERSRCAVALGEPLSELAHSDDGFRLTTSRRELSARRVVLATGGRSYPDCGTTGDGYGWAAVLGHTVVAPRPALVPITTHATWVRTLQGITVPDARVQVVEPARRAGVPPAAPCRAGVPPAASCRAGVPPAPLGPATPSTLLAEQRGSVLFAHFGLSGPAVLDVSRAVSGHPRPGTLVLRCDFLPDLKSEAFEAELQHACQAAGKRQLAGVLPARLPQRLAETLIERAGLEPARRAAELVRHERQAIVAAVKQLDVPVAGTLGFRKAEVTAGGVALHEVDSRTLQSKLVPGLYFAGELLDLDGPIGGYNFQAAFSTGWLAGDSV